MGKCKECKFYEQCKTKGKVCTFFMPKYCDGINCDECRNKAACNDFINEIVDKYKNIK